MPDSNFIDYVKISCASRLDDYETGKGYRLAFPMPAENNGTGVLTTRMHAEENFAVDVNEIAATLGKENAAAIHTDGGRLVRKDGGFRKPLAVAVNDGAVLVLW